MKHLLPLFALLLGCNEHAERLPTSPRPSNYITSAI
jgi:hypothetical protein